MFSQADVLDYRLAARYAWHEFDSLARDDFANLPRDAHGLTSVALLAEANTSLQDAAQASILYGLMTPFASRTPSPRRASNPPVSHRTPSASWLRQLVSRLGA